MDLNRIYCEDCFITMDKMIEEGITIDNVITSPFYNTCRGSKYHATEKSREKHEGRYDVHLDNMTDEEYIDFTLRLFNKFDKILKKDGCILYNMNYGTENTHLMWLVVADIIRNTNFIIADDIIWKKKSALPNKRMGRYNCNSKSVICITTKRIFLSINDGARYYNCLGINITKCCKNKRKTCGKLDDGTKLVWKYIKWNHNKKYKIIERNYG